MAQPRTTRRVYSVEELFSLRGTVSLPRLREAIEERDGDDAELVKGGTTHISHCIMYTSNLDFTSSPDSFYLHSCWVDRLVNEPPTPTPQQKCAREASLTARDNTAEHVLRGSKSFAVRSWRSRPSANSLRVPSGKENRSTTASDNVDQPQAAPLPEKPLPILGELAPNNQILRPGPIKPRPSPTPSIRKKKIESLVKAHGSPTHVRVTAGGRIVPSEQSPLCHPRYGYSAVKVNGGLVKFAPNHPMGKAQWTQATQNGFVAQDINGQLCQIVDGTILPLNEVDGALQLFMPAPNLNITQRGTSLGAMPGRVGSGTHPQQRQTPQIVPPEPSNSTQINALELEYSKLEHELKEVDKTEVIHGRTMNKVAKDALIGKRRELVVSMDKIRKALKSLRDQDSAIASASPLSSQDRSSASPPKSRLPPFLQQRHQNNAFTMLPPQPAAYGHYYGMPQPMPQPMPYGMPYGFQPTPSPDSVYNGQPWMMPPQAVFVPPPPFDGSMSSASLPYQAEAYLSQVPQVQQSEQMYRPQAERSVPNEAPATEAVISQDDGTRSYTDLQKLSPPRHSHAVEIKAPEQRGVKSGLNPMSPAYKPGGGLLQERSMSGVPTAKPVKDRAPTPLSPLHQLQPRSTDSLRVVNKTDESTLLKMRSSHMASSSISSFETADFFPSNTREYSMRKYDQSPAADMSEDKENQGPKRWDSMRTHTPTTPHTGLQMTHGHPTNVDAKPKHLSPQTEGYRPPTVPPGTPVDAAVASNKHSLPLHIDGTTWERHSHGFDVGTIPDRSAHNLSPKNKRREWLFVEEHPDRFPSRASSSPEKFHACQDELCVTSSPYAGQDFSDKSQDWLAGYQAGLSRNPPGFDRSPEFLQGYCAALLQPKSAAGNIEASTGSPVKSAPRRPSPVTVQSRSSSGLYLDRRRPALAPLETHVQSMDTLKQAIFAPNNENAILTPAIDGPHVDDAPFNLGAWAKAHSGAHDLGSAAGDAHASFPFPSRTSSVLKRQNNSSDDHLGPKNETKAMLRASEDSQASNVPLLQTQRAGNQMAELATTQDPKAKRITSDSAAGIGNRVGSITSMDSNLYRSWPGSRVFSPHLEWKSASSVAHHAGLATGFFAQVQFDGTSQNASQAQSGSPTGTNFTAPQPPMRTNSRFKEQSIDGMTDPPASPPMSPPMSPKVSPGKTKDSPSKGGSPARAKFEHIAEKVGIKIAKPQDAAHEKPAGGDAGYSPGKRRWRSVWRGSRKENSKDDNA